MYKLTLNEQSALNIIGCIVVVAINTIINFVLSPYIVAHLGIEANGYITLANNFVSYITLATIALNSMAGRFILIDYKKKSQQSANEYYSSVLLGDWILATIFIIPMFIFVIFIDHVIKVPTEYVWDTRILFAVVFFNYLFSICLPQWQIATYCTNCLYLRSLRNATSTIVRAVAIYLLFILFDPHSYYVAIAAILMSLVNIFIDYRLYMKLMPELKWRFSYFKFNKVKELISSGIWNTISQCGNLLLEGLDILIANIFINPIASGILALSKVVPNMINQITGNIATTYGPRLTYLYADGKMKEMVCEVKNNIMIISIIANFPIGLFLVFGEQFFLLWIPSQNAHQLSILSTLSLIGMLFVGISQCIVNIFGIVNKLKLNSLVVIGSGLVNISIVFLLLRFTDLGVYSIVGVSSVVSILRIFLFTAPYAAYCIDAKWYTFIPVLLQGATSVIVPIAIGFVLSCFFDYNSWFALLVLVMATICISSLIEFYLLLNKSQRLTIFKLLHINK